MTVWEKIKMLERFVGLGLTTDSVQIYRISSRCINRVIISGEGDKDQAASQHDCLRRDVYG